MSEEGRSQSHSWRVVAPGRARRPSASEVNDFGPWQAARARWETSQVPRAPAAPRGRGSTSRPGALLCTILSQ